MFPRIRASHLHIVFMPPPPPPSRNLPPLAGRRSSAGCVGPATSDVQDRWCGTGRAWPVLPLLLATALATAGPAQAQTEIWSATLTTGQDSSGTNVSGFATDLGSGDEDFGSLDDTTFTHEMVDYTITQLFVTSNNHLFFATTPDLPSGGAGLVLQIEKTSGELDLHLANSELTNDFAIVDGPEWIFYGAPTADTLLHGEVDSLDLTAADVMIDVRLSTGINAPATGNARIEGGAQVGTTLTANTTSIEDAEGLAGVSYSYQWIRVEADTTESDISGATNSTYTVTSSDLGKALKVKVDFTDDDSNAETKTSEQTAKVAAMARSCTPGNAWCATLTVGYKGYCLNVPGRCDSQYGALSDDEFTLGTTDYMVKSLRWGDVSSDYLHLTLDQDFPATSLANLTLKVGTHELALSDATRGNDSGENPASNGVANNYRWLNASQFENFSIGVDVTVELLDATASDVTLSALSLVDESSNPVTLSPAFVSGTTSYAALVANSVETVTITATKTATGATVTISPTDDGSEAGHQVALDVGLNAITVTVVNSSTTGTYTVTVRRAAAAASNTPATGEVVIEGGAQVGKTLTADLSGISDSDGLTTPGYSGQWIRVNDDDSKDNISGAVGSTYMVTAADVGKRLEVKVDFTDDDSNAETKTSAPTAKVAAVARDCTPGNAWCATLTVEDRAIGPAGYCLDVLGRCPSQYGALSDDDFTLGSVDYLVKSIRWGTDVNSGDMNLHLSLDRDFPGASLASLTLKVDAHEFVLSDAIRVNAQDDAANNYKWDNIPQAIRDFGSGVEVTVDLLGSIATDDATLSDLTVVTTSGGHAVSLTPAFDPDTTSYEASVAYTVPTVTVAPTTNASSATATIVPTDTDFITNGHQVDLSTGLNAVTLTVVDGSTTGTYTVTVTREAVPPAPACDSDEIWCATLTVGSTTTSAALFGWGTGNRYDGAGLQSDSGDEVVTFEAGSTGDFFLIANDNARGGTVGLEFKDSTATWLDTPANRNSLSFRVESDTFAFADASWDPANKGLTWINSGLTWAVYDDIDMSLVRILPDNTAATGDVTISGIPRNPQHGLTLTADTSGISDSDGLATPGYTYQWVRVDGLTEDDISGATGSTYTVTAADVGKTLKVRVEFTDDADNAEMLTSDATATVVAQSVISFDSAMYTVTEGGSSVQVRLNLMPVGEETGSVDLMRTYQGTAMAEDISGLPTSVSFQRGSSAASHTVSAVNDEDDDDGESIRITLGALPPWMTLGSPAEVTITLVDDDGPAVDVEFGAAEYTATEDGTDAVVVVTLSADPEREVEILITKTNQDGASSADYSGVPGSLTFESGDTSKSFTVSAADDSDNDDGESVLLGFGTPPSGVTAGSLDEAVVKLTDNDSAIATACPTTDATQIWCATLTSGRGSGYLGFASDPTSGVDIKGNLSDPTFIHGSGSITYTIDRIDVGSIGGDISFAANPSLPENGAGLTLHIEKMSGELDLAFSSGRVFVPDGDGGRGWAWNSVGGHGSGVLLHGGTLDFSDATADGTLVRVRLTAVPNTPATGKPGIGGIPRNPQHGLTLTADPSGISDSNGLATPGYTYQWIRVDGSDEGDLSGATGSTYTVTAADVGKTLKVRVEFTDDADNAEMLTSDATATVVAQSVISFYNAMLTVAEGAGTATMGLILTPSAEGNASIDLLRAYQGTAMAEDISGLPTSVSFQPGSSDVSFPVLAVDDEDDDDGESIRITLGTLPPWMTLGSPAEVIVTLEDNDAPRVEVNFGASSYTATEGGTDAEVSVELSAPPGRSVTIMITKANQGTTTGADYSGVPANVMFNASQTIKTFTVVATDDSDDDDGESVVISLGILPTGVVAGTPNTTVNLVDDDYPTLTVSIEAASGRVAEGSSVAVTVRLSGPPERRVSIPLVDRISAFAPTNVFPEDVEFEAMETVKVVMLHVLSDSVSHIGEAIIVSIREFGLPTGIMRATGSGASVTVTVVDDDFNYTASYADADQVFLVDEDAGSVTVTVRLRTPRGILEADLDLLDETTVLSLSSADDTATAGSDYTAVSGELLSFAPSDYTDRTGAGECGCAEAEKTVTVAILEDSVWEGSTAEEFGLVLDGTGSRVAYDPPSGGDQAVVQITDNDAEPTVSFTASATEVGEDVGTVTLTATISGTEYAEDQELTLEFTGTATQGMSPDDYTVSGTMLTLARETAGASATVTVTVVDDTVDEDDEETIIATLKRGTTEVGTVTVTITDDDGDDVIVSFDSSMYTATEGGAAAVVMVSLSQTATVQTVITITTEDQGDTVPGDYSGVPGA